ncbi:DUF1616 domain-containing protein [Halorientalis marina]|uniref:DUF1616 domain-containing protein n=1 Tax=Halorientalis marina TaxID=2931976 RepID=UPI001FF69575|nr:DUF1616 domain-containing protein [Halorientalis marina]
MSERVQVQNNSTTVLESQRLRRSGTTLAHTDSCQREYAVQPTMPGQRLRLAFLLYRGSVPAAPSVENAYREIHLWINVTDS